jgi:hypothetical protein
MSSVLETGFDRSRSIFPFSSIVGIKEEDEKIARRSPSTAKGETTIISNEETT